ncbi:MAG TPA: redoxin domain-containing protein [Phycisphaerae bacterium]|nr:redoxin domain-containing protein [Phycisphaerae bacterium]
MRMALLLPVLLGCVLAGTRPALADLEKGTYAPDLEAKDWYNTEESLSLKDMRGLVVVLYFWVSWHRGGEVAMKEINIVHNHRVLGRNMGVMAIGVTDAARSQVERTLKEEKATFPVALECKAYEEYRIESFPRCVVIDPHGKIQYSGEPTEEVVRVIFDILADTPPSRTRPSEVIVVHRRLEEARNALRDRDFRRAFTAAREAYEHAVTGDPLKAKCQDMLELIDMIGRDKLSEAEQMVDDKNYDKAVSNLRWIVRTFQGAEIARDSRKRLQGLKNQYDEVAKIMTGNTRLVEAAKLLSTARERIIAQDFGAAYDALQKIKKDCPDTEVVPIADGILQRMQAQTTVAAILRDHIAKAECETLLAQARTAIARGRRRDAEEYLRKILDGHPNTRYEREAVDILKTLR